MRQPRKTCPHCGRKIPERVPTCPCQRKKPALMLALALLLLALAGCSAPEPAAIVTAPAAEPAVATVPAVAVADAAVAQAIEALPLPEPTPVEVPAGDPPLVSADGAALIVRWEVGSPALYTRKYERPVCPMCTSTASGPTIGIGYDLGHATGAAVDLDWRAHPQRPDLHGGLGVTGRAAIPVTAGLQHVVTPYPLAFTVFQEASVVKYWRSCRRAFGPEAWDAAPQAVQDVLVSNCYNRGTSMLGDKRAELREIRDVHLPARNWRAIADAIRRSARHWPPERFGRGLENRRNDEAAFLEART
ncbi:MAG: hypothetical protein AB7V08_13925 [Elusimicrobiales bacterium]